MPLQNIILHKSNLSKIQPTCILRRPRKGGICFRNFRLLIEKSSFLQWRILSSRRFPCRAWAKCITTRLEIIQPCNHMTSSYRLLLHLSLINLRKESALLKRKRTSSQRTTCLTTSSKETTIGRSRRKEKKRVGCRWRTSLPVSGKNGKRVMNRRLSALSKPSSRSPKKTVKNTYPTCLGSPNSKRGRKAGSEELSNCKSIIRICKTLSRLRANQWRSQNTSNSRTHTIYQWVSDP